jgi:tetratricopeptide (TPR) repeat protein
VSDGYSLRDVGRLLGLPRSIIGGLIEAGFVTPSRGRRREYRFSFQDLVVLRTAQALVEAKLPSARILRSLRRLRNQIPPQMPLSGLRVEAVGDAVVVREGDAQWQPHDGQYVLRLQIESAGGQLAFFDAPPGDATANDLFEQATELEDVDPVAACDVYRRVVAASPLHRAAYANLGRLLHIADRLEDSEAVYRAGLERCGPDATLLFNLATVLEEREKADEAADMYRAALRESPDLPEAHYNLAMLCDAAGRKQEAIRHLSAYRKLRRH